MKMKYFHRLFFLIFFLAVLHAKAPDFESIVGIYLFGSGHRLSVGPLNRTMTGNGLPSFDPYFYDMGFGFDVFQARNVLSVMYGDSFEKRVTGHSFEMALDFRYWHVDIGYSLIHSTRLSLCTALGAGGDRIEFTHTRTETISLDSALSRPAVRSYFISRSLVTAGTLSLVFRFGGDLGFYGKLQGGYLYSPFRRKWESGNTFISGDILDTDGFFAGFHIGYYVGK